VNDYVEPEGTPCGDDTTNACTEPDTCDGEGVCLPNNLECAFVTDSELCPFDVEPGACETDNPTFRVLFTPDVQNWVAYKQNATNPGQYYYNLIYEGSAGETVRIVVPWPFVTQGAQPVHVYDGDSTVIEDDCFKPCFNSSEACDALSSEGIYISLEDWADGGASNPAVTCDEVCGPNGVGNCWFDVALPEHPNADNCNSDGSCKYYVNVHLDWGLKGPNVDANPCDDNLVDRYDVGDPSFTSYDAEVDDPDNLGTLGVGLANCRTFQFCHDSSLTECSTAINSDSVQNVNTFKNIAGVFGQASSSDDGSPAGGLVVELFRKDTGDTVQNGVTDEDGFYVLPYKHKGKPALYKVVLYAPDCVGGIIVQEVELQGNGWAEVNFDTFGCSSTAEYGKGRNKTN